MHKFLKLCYILVRTTCFVLQCVQTYVLENKLRLISNAVPSLYLLEYPVKAPPPDGRDRTVKANIQTLNWGTNCDGFFYQRLQKKEKQLYLSSLNDQPPHP